MCGSLALLTPGNSRDLGHGGQHHGTHEQEFGVDSRGAALREAILTYLAGMVSEPATSKKSASKGEQAHWHSAPRITKRPDLLHGDFKIAIRQRSHKLTRLAD
jgi:hypothetical protein